MSIQPENLEAITLGLSNSIFRVTRPIDGMNLLVRLFGSVASSLIDRAESIRAMECFSAAGASPRVVAVAPDGSLEEFVGSAKMLSHESVRDANVVAMMADALAAAHAVRLPPGVPSALVPRLRSWAARCATMAEADPLAGACVAAVEPVLALLRHVGLGTAAGDGSWGALPHGMCHNDAQPLNALVGGDGRMVLIDLEYAAVMPVAYDIANHFCEWGHAYDGAAPEAPHPQCLPTGESRHAFLSRYLAARASPRPDAAGTPRRYAGVGGVGALDADATLLAPAAHLHWALWGVLHSAATAAATAAGGAGGGGGSVGGGGGGGFNYATFAAQRLAHLYLLLPSARAAAATASRSALPPPSAAEAAAGVADAEEAALARVGLAAHPLPLAEGRGGRHALRAVYGRGGGGCLGVLVPRVLAPPEGAEEPSRSRRPPVVSVVLPTSRGVESPAWPLRRAAAPC